MNEKRYVVKEQSLKNLADTIREKTGTVAEYDIDEMPAALESIGMPEQEELNVIENGEYLPETYGFSKVTVAIPDPEQEELTATENGEYTPTTYGFSKVSVDVQPEREEITITKAGTYIPTTYGYKKVVVDVPTRNFEEEEF